MEKNIYQKRLILVIVLLLCLLLYMTGTLAWRDLSQHKTDKFTTTSVEHNVVLVENFEEVSNWKTGTAMIKEVFVRNGQDSDDPSRYIYDDAYVRIQLKEYMQITHQSYIYSDDRFMVDEKGDFIKFDTEEDASTFLEAFDDYPSNKIQIKAMHGLYDGLDENGNDRIYFYIATKQANKNGQYGKFLIINKNNTDPNSIVQGQENHDEAAASQHNNKPEIHDGSGDYSNDEDLYTVHEWQNNQDNFVHEDNPFKEFVSWDLGDVIALEDWDGQPIEKWILDTTSTEGWAYWGMALTHSNNAQTNPSSITKNLLENVTLLKQPDGIAEYYIHVNMDATSRKDLNKWLDAPEALINALRNSN